MGFVCLPQRITIIHEYRWFPFGNIPFDYHVKVDDSPRRYPCKTQVCMYQHFASRFSGFVKVLPECTCFLTNKSFRNFFGFFLFETSQVFFSLLESFDPYSLIWPSCDLFFFSMPLDALFLQKVSSNRFR